ncbi:MAG: SNF2-related protein [Burkholderiales bacterium]
MGLPGPAGRETTKPPPPHYEHQKLSLKVLEREARVLDLSDPGTGKTRVHLEDYANRRRNGAKCLLVIAPKSLLHTAWELDFMQFAPDMTCSVAYATNRDQAFAMSADVYITNTDAVIWLAKQPKRFFEPFDHVIIDEITAFKHHTSRRSRALSWIIDYFPTRRGLSGSLNTNGVTDSWHPAFLIDGGKRLGQSFYAFRNAVQVPQQVGPKADHVKWVDKPNAEASVGFLIKDITIRHVFEDCVDMPKNHTYARKFQLAAKHRKIYEELKRNSSIHVKNREISAVNAAVLRAELLQIASGAVYDSAGNYAVIDSSRYELIADLIEEKAHSIVFFQWRHQRDELAKEAKRRKLTYAIIDGTASVKARNDAVQYFQAGFYDFLLCHPQSAAHGLTLTRGTRTIWPSPTDNLEHFIQANRRIYRIGQRQRTETIGVLAEDTFDEVAWQNRERKNIALKSLMAYLKPDGSSTDHRSQSQGLADAINKALPACQ